MVSALDSRSHGPSSSPGWGTVLCSWARHFTLIVPLFTQVYKLVPANLQLGLTPQWTSIPSRGHVQVEIYIDLAKPKSGAPVVWLVLII